jgi:N-acetylglutamate synthase-like GNAT family acetyltransferase
MRAIWNEKLRDGTPVVIRPIERTDAERERAFIESLSTESTYYRFLQNMKTPSPELIRRFTEVDQDRDVALIALAGSGDDQRIVGVSRYFLCGPDSQVGECAVVVGDAWQKRGLGTLLMRHLIEIARERGLERLFSLDLAENRSAQELVTRLGFRRVRDTTDPRLVEHTLELRHT